MALRLLTAPTVEPVSLDEAKEHCRIDGDEDNGHLSLCITAAREYCEKIQNRAYITQTWKLTADAFPRRSCRSELWSFDGREFRDNRIELPRSPLQSVSITYVDQNGTTQTWSSSNYIVDAQSEPGRILLAYGAAFPETRCQANAVTITYIAGNGAAATAVPATVKMAMRLLIGHWFENREAMGTVTDEIAFAVESLLQIDRVF